MADSSHARRSGVSDAGMSSGCRSAPLAFPVNHRRHSLELASIGASIVPEAEFQVSHNHRVVVLRTVRSLKARFITSTQVQTAPEVSLHPVDEDNSLTFNWSMSSDSISRCREVQQRSSILDGARQHQPALLTTTISSSS